MTTDFFKTIVRWNIERNGTTSHLPYLYYDNLSMAAVYTASTSEVRKLIPHPELHLMELRTGRCLVAFAAFEYRQTDGGPNNEVNISFLATCQKRTIPLLGMTKAMRLRTYPSYVWQLPVTEDWARVGGVDLFGYPKFLADIQFSKDQDQIRCTLSVSGTMILNMTGRVLATRQERPIRYVTYTFQKDSLLVSDSLINPVEFAQFRNGKDMFLEIGDDHPIGQTLKNIKLSRQPLVYQFSPQNEAILFPARNILDG